MRKITEKQLMLYEKQLTFDEKSETTIGKYLHDVRAFCDWNQNKPFDKSTLVEYKKHLVIRYAPASVNASISSLNSFFSFAEWNELKMKTLKMQRQLFADERKMLKRSEYERLLICAEKEKKKRLCLVVQTICACGIRVSELQYVTVESLKTECAEVNNKGKIRKVFLPSELCQMLSEYCKENNQKSGSVFVTKNGNPLDRSNIWSDMKKLCKEAGVPEKKVFPHNLRHLFARTYYKSEKDIVRLADILGHSSVNTTRIYTAETGNTHQKQIQKLGLTMKSTT